MFGAIPSRLRSWRETAQLACLFLAATVGLTANSSAAEGEFSATFSPLVQKYCFDCHAGDQTEAGVNLENLSANPSFAASFKTWDKVVAMLEARKMPPDDAPQPSDAERSQLVSTIRGEFKKAAEAYAGDPGRVVLRRLTSAEYAYTIQDLTGLDLNLEREFDSDAVGGEGFANIGDVQFVQDSTLERYLEAAKRVAAHAVIGAGPLHFYPAPGKTGFELSAINRIQEIYRAHGFRTGAGEGGEPFGLDHYPNAFYAAWRYQHREMLGIGDTSLAELAAAERLDVRFVEHIWMVLTGPSPSFPISEIVAGWRQLPVPAGNDEQLAVRVRASCQDLYRLLNEWQVRLAAAADDKEEAPVLTESAFQVATTHSFLAVIDWPDELPSARVHLSVVPAGAPGGDTPVIIWRNPRVRFRQYNRRWSDERPLESLVAADSAQKLAFGKHPSGRIISPRDFVTVGAAQLSFDLAVPETARRAELLVDAHLDIEQGGDCVVRCAISETAMQSSRRAVSAIIADPDGAAFADWKRGVLEFARNLPQVSHREPAPSDRDPIPPPFDNTYNNPQRDHFHYRVKYHRDDRFLVEKMLDDVTRRRLDQAWADLLASFEYHDIILQFVAGKYGVDLGRRDTAKLDAAWIDSLPAEPRQYVQHLADEHRSIQATLNSAQPPRVDDAIRFAGRAWRRPLTADEQQRLRSFYEGLRSNDQLDHPAAIRALLARILVAPAFLYRVEPPSGRASVTPLSNWELASRLSYFLWSSMPDAELMDAAESGELSDPARLAHQAERMLRDPKARRLATEFFGQWFGFYRFDSYRGVDPGRFPEFTDELKAAMYDEAVSFFEHIVREDRPVAEILFADYAYVNQGLAQHYGIKSARSLTNSLQRVDEVQRFQRGGLLGLGAVLTVTSAPLRTSPVKRGDWILRRVIGTPVPPPPADAGSIPADDVLADRLSVRARLEAHRRNASCTNCHARIDALGFALENYDPLGRWRDQYRDGQTIETSGTLNDGTVISGPDGLQGYLKSQQRQFQRTLCTKLLGYALGRAESFADRILVEQMIADLQTGEGRFSNLVTKIVTSRQFRYYHVDHDNPGTTLGATSTRPEGNDHVER